MVEREDWDAPGYFDDDEADIYWDMAEHDQDLLYDDTFELLVHSAMFDMELSAENRAALYEAMTEYLEDNYDLIFEEIFDWEDYRDWYDSAA